MAPRPKPWFRFYVEAVHDRKLRRLKAETRWLFVACLAAARQSPRPGWLLVGEDDPMDFVDLADFAHMTVKQVEKGTDALTDAGVLAFDLAAEAWHIPSWGERQYESDNSTSRTQKHRNGTTMERSIDAASNDDVPFRERSPSETETEGQRNFVPSDADPSSSSLSVQPLYAVGGAS